VHHFFSCSTALLTLKAQAFITMASEIKSRMQSQPNMKQAGAAPQVNLSGNQVKSGGGCC
jgi:hypothetical protein